MELKCDYNEIIDLSVIGEMNRLSILSIKGIDCDYFEILCDLDNLAELITNHVNIRGKSQVQGYLSKLKTLRNLRKL